MKPLVKVGLVCLVALLANRHTSWASVGSFPVFDRITVCEISKSVLVKSIPINNFSFKDHNKFSVIKIINLILTHRVWAWNLEINWQARSHRTLARPGVFVKFYWNLINNRKIIIKPNVPPEHNLRRGGLTKILNGHSDNWAMLRIINPWSTLNLMAHNCGGRRVTDHIFYRYFFRKNVCPQLANLGITHSPKSFDYGPCLNENNQKSQKRNPIRTSQFDILSAVLAFILINIGFVISVFIGSRFIGKNKLAQTIFEIIGLLILILGFSLALPPHICIKKILWGWLIR